MIIFGLSLSIPLLVIGSNWVAKLMNRYPIVVYIGAAVLAYTAVRLIIFDRGVRLAALIGQLPADAIPALCGLAVLVYGFRVVGRRGREPGR
jgi:predicted tellurium resistance membrane protein TerC